ncbi:Pyridoxamine 5'-phosphate oxidase [Rhodovulum sp. ES.010]|uniref:pyridoxamine 5'-phosphate oxidase family protein n=1 Tax=Rhodovulum sp. ES.010 TaxID=1882821 RepID=UPI0009268BA5|nr:pyridoxamine 5'-phosphate oxidase family protein [Rhodovulum sp. ES.010]SIO53347.1 Pyridoxamine 5'-phosphate oxidase [Rhodovulum sp. ES.010]
MSDPLATLPGTLDAVWARLEAGPRDRAAPARHPVLATVGTCGAEVRMVVLRAAERAQATVEIFTDRRSAKIRDLAAEPRASLLVWDPDALFQIRLRARFHPLDDPPAAARWDALPAAARALYGAMPPPGTPIGQPEEHNAKADPAAFCALQGMIDEIETLHLAAAPHRRARFHAEDAWAGQWCAP